MLGAIPPKDPLEGIEHKVRFALAINGIRKTPQEISAISARHRKNE
jgi:hypothetical protein